MKDPQTWSSLIYSVSFLMALTGLVLWSSFPKHRSGVILGRILLVVGITLWAGTLVFSELAFQNKLLAGFRELMVLGGVGFLISWTKSNRIINLGLILGLIFFLQTSYLDMLQSTITQQAHNVDPNGELIVSVSAANRLDLLEFAESYHLEILQPFTPQDPTETTLDDAYILDLPNREGSATEITQLLSRADWVDWWEENEMITVEPMIGAQATGAQAFTNDPQAGKLWAFETCLVSDLHDLLSSQNVKTEKKALIAILDSGVDAKHEDLKDNYLSTNSLYDKDIKGHGTHCAGIIGAVSNNGLGIASFTPRAGMIEISSIKVLRDHGFGSQADIIKGMIEAADLGADVLSMSLGGPSNDARQKAYSEAVKYCNSKGAIVVVAAGNSNMPASKFAPANTPGVIAVSSINKKLAKSSFSNTVDDVPYGIAAPGENIYSTFPNHAYKALSGTSMATPYVASLVGIMKGLKPDLRVEEVHRILSGTGISSKDPAKTGKIIQPTMAIRAILD